MQAKVKLIRKEVVAQGTMAFHFAKPPGFEFRAGQFAEFALIDPMSGLVHPFPRPISLKNASIFELQRFFPKAQFGPLITGTPKGDLCHMVPDMAAIATMNVPAPPALILFPRFGHAAETRDVGQSEAFVRLTQASTNYVALGEPGFDVLSRLITSLPAKAIDYPDTETALKLVESLW